MVLMKNKIIHLGDENFRCNGKSHWRLSSKTTQMIKIMLAQMIFGLVVWCSGEKGTLIKKIYISILRNRVRRGNLEQLGSRF